MKSDAEAAIDLALVEAKGDVPQAAMLLGVTPATLRSRIHDSRILKARWAERHNPTAVPSEAIVINRPPLEVEASDAEIAEAIKKQDALVRRGIKDMGFDGKTLDMAMSLQAFQRKHFMSALDLMAGGLVKSYLDVMVEVENLNASINTDLPLEQEQMRREDRSRLLDLMIKMYDRTARARLTLVDAAAKESSKKAGASKPGFNPLVVKGRNIQVNLDGKKPSQPG